jgi:hypothetical protein
LGYTILFAIAMAYMGLSTVLLYNIKLAPRDAQHSLVTDVDWEGDSDKDVLLDELALSDSEESF